MNNASVQRCSEPVFDIETIRKDFPILSREVNGKPLVYLDNGATAQKPAAVIDAIDRYYRQQNANIHRGVHYLSQAATVAYEEARDTIARWINAPSSCQVLFTRGTTDGINLVASSWGRLNLGPGDEVIVTTMEHHSNIVPWQMVCEESGARLRVVPVFDNGELDVATYLQMLNEKTRLVAVTHVSNTLGTINPVDEMIRKAHEWGGPRPYRRCPGATPYAYRRAAPGR